MNKCGSSYTNLKVIVIITKRNAISLMSLDSRQQKEGRARALK